VIVLIPSALRSYTAEQGEVEAAGKTVAQALSSLDRKFPGLRFRIVDEHDKLRQHIKLYVNEELTDDLGHGLGRNDKLHIICALSGG